MRSNNKLVGMSIFLLTIAPPVFAKEQHGAHVHGSAKLDIAVEGKTATVELESPAMDIYGFEHEAKSPKEVKVRDEAVAKLKGEGAKMLVFDGKLGCQVVTKKVEPFVTEDHDKGGHKGEHKSEHGEHGEVHAEFTVTCTSALSGTELKLGFWDVFPKMQTIQVQVVGEKSQGGGKLSKGKSSIKL